jgi:hypothetical protein
MRRVKATRTWRGILFGRRMVQLALMGTVMVTAIAAAQIAAKPDPRNDDAMAKTLTKQKVAAGQSVKPATPSKQTESLTADQMLYAAASYEVDMDKAVQHAEKLRIIAYQSKDIIRMTFIDTKLGEIKEIQSIAKPLFVAIKQPGTDLFGMRSKFTTLQQGWERVNQIMAEIEAASGDTADPTSATGAIEQERADPSKGVTDPTQPASPSMDFERPPAASPFR